MSQSSVRRASNDTVAGRARRAVAMVSAAVSIFAGLHAQASAADPERGRLLYENHCQFCHTPQVHSRPSKLPLTRGEMRDIVDHWRAQQNLRWSEEETEDVVEYLNRTRYRFAPSENAPSR